jgi:hypothetical protein
VVASGALASVIEAADLSPSVAEKCLALVDTVLLRAPQNIQVELLTTHGLLQFVLTQAGEGVAHAVRVTVEKIAMGEHRALLLTKESAQSVLKVSIA